MYPVTAVFVTLTVVLTVVIELIWTGFFLSECEFEIIVYCVSVYKYASYCIIVPTACSDTPFNCIQRNVLPINYIAHFERYYMMLLHCK